MEFMGLCGWMLFIAKNRTGPCICAVGVRESCGVRALVDGVDEVGGRQVQGTIVTAPRS